MLQKCLKKVNYEGGRVSKWRTKVIPHTVYSCSLIHRDI